MITRADGLNGKEKKNKKQSTMKHETTQEEVKTETQLEKKSLRWPSEMQFQFPTTGDK